MKVKVSVTQSSLTLHNPMDCSSSGSSLHGISQTRILEWVAISFSRDLPNLGIASGLMHCRQILYWLSHQRYFEMSVSLFFHFSVLILTNSSN